MAIAQNDTYLREGALLADRFRLVRRLGEGSIGVVWLAEDVQLDNDLVACKVLRESLASRREMVADLKREVLLSRRLRHPNILAVYTFWDSPEAKFLTMEYLSGRSLAEALDERGAPFTVREVLRWVKDVSDALDYAHADGVLHRDVKPGNVLLCENGQAHLADFGIARAALHLPEPDDPEPTKGTIYYMSPEQLSGAGAEARSDLYGLAATLYHLLSGTPPFHEGGVLAQIQIKPPAPIPQLSEAMNRELLRALSKSPDKRHTSCGDFYEALAAAASGTIRQEVVMARTPNLHRENAPTVVLGDFAVGTRRTRLGRLLIEQGLLSQELLADALLEQQTSGEKLGAILIRRGHVSETMLATTLATQLQVSLTTLAHDEIDVEVARALPRDLAERYLAVPMKRSQYGVLVGMADPLDMEALNRLESIYEESIDPLVALESDVRAAIERVYPC